jgi:Tat protein translocase TatB subunit
MFGLSFTHLVLFGVIALIFIGPEQLPEVARTIGRILNELRRATQDFQNQFTGQFRDETQAFKDLHQQIQNPVKQPWEIQHTNTDQYSHDHSHDQVQAQGHESAAAPAAAASAEAPSEPQLPAGSHPVSDDEGNKS